MNRIARAWRLGPAAGLAALLSGCAQTELVVHTLKLLQGPEPPSKSESARIGTYKIGNPYKIDGTWYYPKEDLNHTETGIASWYGADFHGKPTANGEAFDMNALTAAHRTLPMPSAVWVTNLENGRSLRVRINDRGPFARGRVIDLSRRSAQLLGFEPQGTARVKVEIDRAETLALKQTATNGTLVAAIAPAPAGKPPIQTVALTQPAAAPMPAVVIEEIVQVPVRPTQLWVQVAAHSDRAAAYRLRDRLARHGPALVASTAGNGVRLYRVRLGPLTSVEEGDSVLSRIVGAGYPEARLAVDWD